MENEEDTTIEGEAEKSNNVGRPSSYKEEYAKQAYKLCLLGYTDKELAKFFNVCEATIDNWKDNIPEFLGSLLDGKDIADANVAESLYNRATGYTHDEEKIFCTEGLITRVQTLKHYPPEVAAMKSWLHNRRSSKWREKVDVTHSGLIAAVIVDDIPDED